MNRMGWSFTVARVAGIEIRVHITFFLILIFGAFQWGGFSDPTGALFGVLLMILLFLCVVLHELGHSLTAIFYGIPVREIVLLPLGGVALLGRNPDKPLHELVIAAAGPLVNVVIAGGLLFLILIASALGFFDLAEMFNAASMGRFTPSLQTLLFWLFSANISLVLFNLIPAFPLDGGRIFRAVLALFMPYTRATRIASSIGQGMAVLLGLLGILSGNLLLALVAAFIFFGAGQESAEVQARAVLRTHRVGDAYNRHALTLNMSDRVSKVADYILTSYQPDFAVMQGNRPLGIITRNDVLQALATNTQDLYVTQIMQRDFLRVDAPTSLHEVRSLMSEAATNVAAVYDGDHYLGLISLDDIAEAFAVITFQQRQADARRVQQGSTPTA